MIFRFDWTKSADRQLQRYLHDGLTYQQIAEAMGMSRNAIAGRVHRLDIGGPRSDPSKARHVGRARA